jgi:hypothetical protein
VIFSSLTFSIETIHHGLYQFKFVLNGEVDEIGIHKNMVRRTKSCIVLEEHGGGYLRAIEEMKH